MSESENEQPESYLWRVILGFSYIYLVMTSYYVLKPVRESFFLSEKGYGNLPIAHLLVLAATLIAVLVYTQATRRLGPARLVTATNVFFLCCIAGFWVFLTQIDTSEGWLNWLRDKMAWVYFCWVSVFSVFAITLFWSLIHTLFNSESGSKCYGIIGSGATLGALSGGFLTKQLAEKLGTENLLLLAAGIIAPCMILGSMLARMSKRSRQAAAEARSAGNAEEGSANDTREYRSAIVIFRNSPYLCVLGLIVMLTVFVSVLDEYRFNQLISAVLSEKDAKTAFFGNVYFWSNSIGLFFSLVLTGIVQSIWGPRPGMTMFAALVVLTGIAFLVAPDINTVFYSIVALQSVGYSIYQWSRELLYTQTSAEEKFVAKGFIDTFMFRFGAGAASFALLAAAAIGSGEDGLLTNAVTQMSYATIPIGLLLASLAWWVSRRFSQLKQASES